MLKKLIVLFLALFVLTFCSLVFADENTYIIDNAAILGDDTKAHFNTESARIYEQYGVKICIATTNVFEETGDVDFYNSSALYMDEFGLYETDGILIYIDHSFNYYYCRSTYEDAYFDLDTLISDSYASTTTYFDFLQDCYTISENYIIENEQIAAQNEALLNSVTLSNVMDTADLLSDAQESELQAIANNIRSEHQIETYIMTINDYNVIEQSYYIEDAGTKFYSENNLGYGDGKDGVFLMLSMQERDFTYFIYGDKTHEIFTESTRAYIEANFLDNFAANDFYGGFVDYFTLTYEEPNVNFAIKLIRQIDGEMLLIAFIIGLALSLFYVSSLKKALNTFKQRQSAIEYIAKGGVDIRIKEDVYTHTTTTRTKISKSSGGGGGGSSRSFSGGGFSGSSGKF